MNYYYYYYLSLHRNRDVTDSYPADSVYYKSLVQELLGKIGKR
jgi:hypothetical protein